MLDIPAFLERVYAFPDEDVDDAMDLVFDTFDQLHGDGKFEVSDAILQQTDVFRLNSSLLCGFLVITKPASPHLPSRDEFFERVTIAMLKLREPEVAYRLLTNLGPLETRSGQVRPEVAELIARVIDENRGLWERLSKI